MGSPEPSPFEDHARAIREAVLRAADPARAVEAHWPTDLPPCVRVLSIGKAAIPMARAALARLHQSGADVTSSLVVTTPHPDTASLAHDASFFAPPTVLIGDHPLATERNVEAARHVARFVAHSLPGEALLLLLSGGGSALLTWPAGDLTLDDLRHTTLALLRAGAPIRELNAVRKHAERLKGGRLARLIPPGVRTVALIVSDVLGDPLDTISSGPVSADPTTYADALAVLERRGLAGEHQRLIEHLGRGLRGAIDETPKPGDAAFANVWPRIIASNQHAAIAARDALLAVGYARVKLVCGVEDEAADVGRDLVRQTLAYAMEQPAEGSGEAKSHAASAPHHATPLFDRRASAVLYAGETTVTVGDAQGLGGRNQELALAAAIELDAFARNNRSDPPRVAVMTLATDGLDGPTDAAGALITNDTVALARTRGINLADALARHDSHHALDNMGCLIRTGPTGTNVNDVAVAMTLDA